ncbi:phage tail protein [Aquimarina sp. AD10]|uniref:Phage tail protein n=1 Tax=Aquimarina aggregata TaxID=1642818 RepID=A0A162WK05_9FLAO|nr:MULTISPECIES: phage tail protein [Aquimarina]AXT61557.1 phage tail protein [Aquimarina sp. AD10]KZS38147.1 phage tail protein [Aquimarina aggregata]RKM90041.1 phage tail protein [Aquimarina sp. AD10]
MAAIGDYPIPKFHFQVEWGDGFRIGFTEVSGLDFETEVIEYREGSSKKYNKSKQPGLTKYSNVTLKRGTFQGDFDFFTEWQKTYLFQEGNDTGSLFRRPVTIKLLNENHEPIITWILENAWPSKVQSTDLKADANEVAIETMELVHEGLTILEAK